MKSSKACPKCACTRLFVIEAVTQPDNESSNGISTTYLRTASLGKDVTGTSVGTRYRSVAGHLEAWACSSCGFAELYVADRDELEKLARHRGAGVRVVEGTTPVPYR